MLMSSILRAWGYRVDAVERGREAVDRVGRGDFAYDAVITDLRMPGMDGMEVLEAVRALDRDVPIVLLTARPSVDTAIKSIEHGAFKYLTKPPDLDRLRETLEHATRLGRLARFEREVIALALADARPPPPDPSLGATFLRALESMWIAYQPVVVAGTGAVLGYEALMRLDDPDHPHPGAMLAAAERLGRIFELGRRVREQAAAPMIAEPDRGLLFINLHPRELLDDSLASPDCPLSRMADRVVLEITERAGLDAVSDLPQRLDALRELGYRIAIDDLGSGHSGLSQLAMLSPEFVKIDMHLVRGVDQSLLKQRLVRSITEVGRDLGIGVVAEGIETPAERDTLTELGCSHLQGFLFARPGPPFPEVAGHPDG